MNFSNSFNVVPSPFLQQPKVVNYFKFGVSEFKPLECITFNCTLFTIDGQYIDTITISMCGNDYSNWGNDDTYLINFLTNKLGLTYLPEPVVEPVSGSTNE